MCHIYHKLLNREKFMENVVLVDFFFFFFFGLTEIGMSPF